MTALPQSVQAALALIASATPGEWENSAGFVRAKNPVELQGDGFKVGLSCTWVAETVQGEGYVPGNGNAASIVAAVNLLKEHGPALLAALENDARWQTLVRLAMTDSGQQRLADDAICAVNAARPKGDS